MLAGALAKHDEQVEACCQDKHALRTSMGHRSSCQMTAEVWGC